MNAPTSVEPETNLDQLANPVVSITDIKSGSAFQKIEANVGVIQAPPTPEHAEAAVKTTQEPCNNQPRFFEPSQPLFVTAVRRETMEPTISNPTVQKLALQETITEVTLTPVTVVPDEDEMNQLHLQMAGSGRTTLMTGITLGELLVKKKASLKRSAWGKWVKANLVFDIRTAQNYMNLHKNREAILEKCETVAHFGIKGACRMLAKPSKQTGAPTAPDDLQVEDVVEVASPNESLANPETKNSFKTDAKPDEPPATEVIVPELTLEQSTKVLNFMKDLDIDPALYESLSTHGGVIRLTAAMLETPNPHLDGAVVENVTEATHE